MASQPVPVDVHAAVGLSSPAPSSGLAGASTPAGSTAPNIPSAAAGLMSPSINTPSASTNAQATYPAQALTALEAYKKKDSSKVVVRFKAIGNAPIMKNNHFRITAFNRFQAVIQFLRKELGWKQGDALVRFTHP